MYRSLFCILAIPVWGCATTNLASSAPAYQYCQADPVRLEARSEELSRIAQADQNDRKNWEQKGPRDLQEIAKRDEGRRMRVGQIYGEGCFSKSSDYAAAALVYQHGNVPDHFYQTFVWAKRAVELGDPGQKRMMALGIDRYLVNVGRKQLFGSQATKSDFKSDSCWCLQQVEKSFPDHKRKEQAGKNLTEAFDWLKELNSGTTCPNLECEQPLKPSPEGTVPGLW